MSSLNKLGMTLSFYFWAVGCEKCWFILKDSPPKYFRLCLSCEERRETIRRPERERWVFCACGQTDKDLHFFNSWWCQKCCRDRRRLSGPDNVSPKEWTEDRQTNIVTPWAKFTDLMMLLFCSPFSPQQELSASMHCTIPLMKTFQKYVGFIIVKPWSKSESKPLSQQAPKSNKSPPKKKKRRIWTKGWHLSHKSGITSSTGCITYNFMDWWVERWASF